MKSIRRYYIISRCFIGLTSVCLSFDYFTVSQHYYLISSIDETLVNKLSESDVESYFIIVCNVWQFPGNYMSRIKIIIIITFFADNTYKALFVFYCFKAGIRNILSHELIELANVRYHKYLFFFSFFFLLFRRHTANYCVTNIL